MVHTGMKISKIASDYIWLNGLTFFVTDLGFEPGPIRFQHRLCSLVGRDPASESNGSWFNSQIRLLWILI